MGHNGVLTYWERKDSPGPVRIHHPVALSLRREGNGRPRRGANGALFSSERDWAREAAHAVVVVRLRGVGDQVDDVRAFLVRIWFFAAFGLERVLVCARHQCGGSGGERQRTPP
jgi:hypothetical protein